jgi:hypothetical protein
MDPRQSHLDWRGRLALAIAPALIAASAAVIVVSSSLVTIGPFDRAQIGWGVGVPLFLLAPGAAALASRHAGVSAARWSIAAIAVVIGILTAAALAATMTMIGCAPATGPLGTLPAAVSVGIAAALAFAGPAGAAWYARRWGSKVAVAVGAIAGFGAIFATILVFAASFIIGVSCAYVPA